MILFKWPNFTIPNSILEMKNVVLTCRLLSNQIIPDIVDNSKEFMVSYFVPLVNRVFCGWTQVYTSLQDKATIPHLIKSNPYFRLFSDFFQNQQTQSRETSHRYICNPFVGVLFVWNSSFCFFLEQRIWSLCDHSQRVRFADL